jgi:hypothetical protein
MIEEAQSHTSHEHGMQQKINGKLETKHPLPSLIFSLQIQTI